jgi:hypothetical protein
MVLAVSLPGCSGSISDADEDSATAGDVNASQTARETIIYQRDDGTLTQRVVDVPLANFQAQLARKQQLTDAAARGELLSSSPIHSQTEASDGQSEGPNPSVKPLTYYGDVIAECYGEDMWISYQSNGSLDTPSNTICFKKNTIGGTGYDNLAVFYMPCGGGSEGKVSQCARSFWSGSDSGIFAGVSGGGISFAAYQRHDSTSLGNFPYLGFY